MEKKIFPKLYYLNNFRDRKTNVYLEERIDGYIQKVLYEDINSYMSFISKLRLEYSFRNYMYLLECIINYIVKIYRLTYYDYIHNRNTYTYETLCNIEKKYKAILLLYNISYADKLGEEVDVKEYKKTRKY